MISLITFYNYYYIWFSYIISTSFQDPSHLSPEESMDLAHKLSHIGVSIAEYRSSFTQTHDRNDKRKKKVPLKDITNELNTPPSTPASSTDNEDPSDDEISFPQSKRMKPSP